MKLVAVRIVAAALLVVPAVLLQLPPPTSGQMDAWNTITYEWNGENVTVDVVRPPDKVECPQDPSEICSITLNVSEILTMTLYPYDPSARGFAGGYRYRLGWTAEVNQDGSFRFFGSSPAPSFGPTFLWPVTADGSKHSGCIAVNNRIPAPTIIARLGQTVRVEVINNLPSESITIHWHGLHAEGYPWSDGVSQVTQCPIIPHTSYTYEFVPKEEGTQWYHTHQGALRTEGLYGALVVTNEEEFAGTDVNPADFVDTPETYTLVLMDWQHMSSTEVASMINSGGTFENPADPSQPYQAITMDNGSPTSQVPFVSGLINTAGWYFQPQNSSSCVPQANVPLEFFPVDRDKTYRFRIVAAMGTFSYRLSIQGHKLKLLATDGVPTKSTPEEVDFIILHAAERYDFLLRASEMSKEDGHYWIVAETLEVPEQLQMHGINCLKGHRAYAILKYSDAVPRTTWPPGIDYDPNLDRSCYSDESCIAINCPFQLYREAVGVKCITVDQLELLKPAPIPTEDVSDTAFLSFSFQGEEFGSSINDRQLVLPPSPPVTQYADLLDDASFHGPEGLCEYSQDPEYVGRHCIHTYTTKTRTVEMAFLNLAPNNSSAIKSHHVSHIHGHYFRVVHIGFPNCSGSLCSHDDIECDGNCASNVTWAGGSRPSKLNFSNSHAPLKDSVIVPGGAYVLVRFEADNPGWWFLHCHLEAHQLGGMAMLVAERIDEIPNPPENIPKCGNFVPTAGSPSNQLNSLETSLVAVAATIGGIFVTMLSSVIAVCCCCCVSSDGCCGYKLTRVSKKAGSGYFELPGNEKQVLVDAKVTMSQVRTEEI